MIVSITVGVDGQLYCHDLTPELVPVLTAVCPSNSELAARSIALCNCKGRAYGIEP